MNDAALDVFRCPLDGLALIEASAGTGKTWNICGLVLRLLLERRLGIDRILVVTFTNAATAELRARIRERIVETLARLRGGPPARDPFVDTLLATLRGERALADGEMAQRLEAALQSFDEASIFTIHGFCQRALADSAFTAGQPMAQELLADDGELVLEVVQDHWRRELAGAGPMLAADLLDRGDTPERWAQLLRRRLARPLARLVWPEPGAGAADPDPAAFVAAHAAARALWAAERSEILAIVEEALPRLPATSYKPAAVEAAAVAWDRLLAAADPFAADGADARSPSKAELLTTRRLQPKKGQAPPRAHAFFEFAGTLLDERARIDGQLALARLHLLRGLLEQGPQRLQAAKRERRVIGFNEMLWNVHERLQTSGGALAHALRTRFPAALIDEFQDTDPLQFSIFDAIYGGTALPMFMVGDPKQAIYSFRGADLHTYLCARERAGTRWTLGENQRSSPELIEAVNAVFGANPLAFMLPGLGFAPVRAGAKPRAAMLDPGGARAALDLRSLPAGLGGATLAKAAARGVAARACALEIARLIAAGQGGAATLGGRGVGGGDIAVLVRSHSQGALMKAELSALGVTCVELSQASVFAGVDAEELERVLAALLEPGRDGLLRAALSTSLMGLDAAGLDAAGEDGLLDFAQRAAAYRACWIDEGVGVMLRRWIDGEGVAARLLARADGERRMTNLLHLADLLQEAAREHPTPPALLRWLAARRADPEAAGDAAQLRLESDRHLVQVVTIHKSKGLEYGFVFCPFLWDGYTGRPQAQGDGVEVHDDEGRMAIDFRPGGPDPALLERAVLDRYAENLRLIYVALTRAVYRCTVVIGAYASGSGASTTQSARAPLNWLVAGAGRTAQEWQTAKPSQGEIGAAWARLAAAHAPAIAIAPLPAAAPAAAAPPRGDPGPIEALPAPARIAPAWWIGSYSSLSRGARHEASARDHDLRLTAGAAAPVPPPALAADDILLFPRGPQAGDCLHAVFEAADFTAPASWPAAIEKGLRERAPAGADESLRPMLGRLLADVFGAVITPGLRLAEVANERRLVEMEFNLPAPNLQARVLEAAMRDEGYPTGALAFGSLSGYLRGFVDLVFEHGGRYHIVDWKSNHLGYAAADYAPARVAQAMEDQGYHLQYLIYSVALHRLLARRLPDYRYETHFGAVHYLFVRGVRPDWPGAGVYTRRPSQRTIERLDALLAGDCK